MKIKGPSYFVQYSGSECWLTLSKRLSSPPRFGILDDRLYEDFSSAFPSGKFIRANNLKAGLFDRAQAVPVPSDIRANRHFILRREQAYYSLERLAPGGQISAKRRALFVSALSDYLWSFFNEHVPTHGILTEAPHTAAGLLITGLAEALEIPLLYFEQTKISPAVRAMTRLNGRAICLSRGLDEAQDKRRITELLPYMAMFDDFAARARQSRRYLFEEQELDQNQKMFRGLRGTLRRFFIPYYWRKGEAESLELFLASTSGNARRCTTLHGIGSPVKPLRDLFLPSARAAICQMLEMRRIRSSWLRSIGTVPEGPFVTLFLHFEPEKTSMPDGGIYSDQLYAVRQIASSLPDGFTLLVKEHPAQHSLLKRGFRARSEFFYDEVSSIPGVTLVADEVGHSELISASRAVVTITGKVALEALALCTPVIALGEAWYRSLEGVFCCEGYEEVSNYLSSALEYAFPGDYSCESSVRDLVASEFFVCWINPRLRNRFSGDDDLETLELIAREFLDQAPSAR